MGQMVVVNILMDYNIQMQERNRQNTFNVNAPYVKIDNAAMILHEKSDLLM